MLAYTDIRRTVVSVRVSVSPSPGTWFISMLAARCVCGLGVSLCRDAGWHVYACMYACMWKHVDLWANGEERGGGVNDLRKIREEE